MPRSPTPIARMNRMINASSSTLQQQYARKWRDAEELFDKKMVIVGLTAKPKAADSRVPGARYKGRGEGKPEKPADGRDQAYQTGGETRRTKPANQTGGDQTGGDQTGGDQTGGEQAG